jgi:hypothetical protein
MWLGLPHHLCHRALQGDVPIRVSSVPINPTFRRSQFEVSLVQGTPYSVGHSVKLQNMYIPLYMAAAAVSVDLLM